LKKVLLVGGAGYIGSVVCEELLSRSISVHSIDKFIYENVGKRRSASGLFWGAIFDAENKMIGQNMLGLILMEKRTSLLKLENL
jgi:UDP-glucose 4-epimerase